MFPVDKKSVRTKKLIIQKSINSFLAHKLSHDPTSYLTILIWMCLQTGGGGILTRMMSDNKDHLGRKPQEQSLQSDQSNGLADLDLMPIAVFNIIMRN